ncbi:TauD/TfdA family dioxygenase [Pseudomonas sp. N040]|uniref:TauD/TfdA family dioxygenase n=1 Tax=Pseudomonas sp. N040 TaxID=2785325 RepID=UPI0018A295CD|nr:TauD/TfdA family dioxygenase [Pseudomonas sp. N040]MBF7731561.1 TauD/TfdA family dioxygenase [Pseudomonas sp. N040]MBW7015205.1 TauD/TfdA family dioxygenase [Pseudomonas sp. N040]
MTAMHSPKPGHAVLAKYDHPAAWTAKSLMAQSDQWIYTLSEADVAELDAALQQIKARGLQVPNFGKDEFHIPQLAARLEPYKASLDFGLGILYLKGFPISRYTKDQASAIFWGIGSHIGKSWVQNNRGHVLGDIRDEGRSFDDPLARGYQTTADLDMHTDGADMVALLCLKQAPEGGENQLSSAVAAYNKLVDSNPQALRHLLDNTYCFDWRGEEPAGEEPFHRAKVLCPVEGAVACLNIIPYILSAQRFPQVPRLTAEDLAAFDAFKKAVWDDELVVRVRQEPGDMLFLNNHYHLHARSTFRDAEEPGEKRHLRRLWLESPAWQGKRPAAMENLLRVSNTWKHPESSVQMWDHL